MKNRSNPVAKNLKQNRPATHPDKKKDYKRGVTKYGPLLPEEKTS